MYDVEISPDEVVSDSADDILHLDDRVGQSLAANDHADARWAAGPPFAI